ncbi:MAG TPA: hypothetical protein VF676_02150 [Flavobacterium sp.]
MKNLLLFLVLVVTAVSCEKEEQYVRNSDVDDLRTAPTLVQKLVRMTQHPATIDNVVDNTSCFSINLPVTVIANSQMITINSESDYQQVRNIFAASDTDTDSVVIQFPIQVTYTDYTTATFNSQAGLNAAASNCVESVELSCLSFDFPLTVKTYDSDSQDANTITLGTTTALFNFLGELLNYEAVSFDYPLNLNTPNGIISVESNSELESVIDSFIAECEAAVNPQPDPNPDPLELDEVIVQGSWRISYYFDEEEHTEDYENYTFSFTAAGAATATSGSGSVAGTWDSYIDSGDLTLEFTFNGSSLGDLEEDWTVTSFTETSIVLAHESGGGGDPEYVTFQRN